MNLIADALSLKTTHCVNYLRESNELIKDFAKLNLEIVHEGELPMRLNALSIQPSFFEEIMGARDRDPKLVKLKTQVQEDQAEGFFIHEDGSLRFKGRWCLPYGESSLKERIL